MGVADYVLAAVCVILSLSWCLGSFMVAAIDAFAPCPNEDTARTARKGCAALVLGLAAAVYFGGVLFNREWGWLT